MAFDATRLDAQIHEKMKSEHVNGAALSSHQKIGIRPHAVKNAQSRIGDRSPPHQKEIVMTRIEKMPPATEEFWMGIAALSMLAILMFFGCVIMEKLI